MRISIEVKERYKLEKISKLLIIISVCSNTFVLITRNLKKQINEKLEEIRIERNRKLREVGKVIDRERH